ncbi:unnamed protein product [Didymodactylos carnosus]|nr:unnamed protein product [Didymodactylos carnosus]CAF4473977.1 unnamed protein product [Didymodactylos carnosus]
MTQRWQVLDSQCLPSSVFALLYLYMTYNIRYYIQNQYFNDGNSLTSFTLKFASYFATAYDSYYCQTQNQYAFSQIVVQQQSINCAKPELQKPVNPVWKNVFDYQVLNKSYVVDDLGLGINAHINRELASVVYDLNYKTTDQKQDYDRVNDILQALIATATVDIGQRYDPLLSSPEFSLAYSAAIAILIGGRQNAWDNGQLYISAPPPLRKNLMLAVQTTALTAAQAFETGITTTNQQRIAYCQAHHSPINITPST